MEKKHLGLRIDADIYFKLRYIAKAEGRSGNGQIIYLINQCINQYEKENGKIEPQK